MLWLLAGLAGLAAYALAVWALTRAWVPSTAPEIRRAGTTVPATDALSVTTWNLGFAGLGAQADFFADGGTSLRPLGRAQISSAADRIAAELASAPADVMLLQEVAGPGFMTRGTDLRGRIERALPVHRHAYASDLRTRGLPSPVAFDHGMSVLTTRDVACDAILPLPHMPKLYAGFVRKHYFGVTTRIPIAGTDRAWLVINIHLSAFDDGARDRHRQLAALIDAAQTAHARGDHVVIGGDWNLRINAATFPHQTDAKHLFWIHDMPEGTAPVGWRWVTDPTTPTVRTLNAPFVAGRNYTMIIDGFLISPNVEAQDVTARELGFADSDHHPVTARLRALPPAPTGVDG